MVSTVQTSGCVTFWTVSDNTSYTALAAALANLPFAVKMPNPRTPGRALQAALTKKFGGPDRLVRPLDTKDGYCVVSEAKGSDDNSYQTIVTCKVTSDGHDIATIPNGSVTRMVKDQWMIERDLVDARAITPALLWGVTVLGGVSLRRTGGIYFVPHAGMSQWEQLGQAVESAGPNSVYRIRMEADTVTLRSVAVAITAEITEASDTLMDAIRNGGLGERAVANRKQAATILRRKVQAYEAILGKSLDGLVTMLDRVDAALTAATLE